MGWVGGREFTTAEPDIVQLESAKALSHMNDDHAHDVLSMARAYAGLPDAKSASLLSIDRYGMEVLCETPSGRRRSRIAFPTRLETGSDIKPAVIQLTRNARQALNKD